MKKMKIEYLCSVIAATALILAEPLFAGVVFEVETKDHEGVGGARLFHLAARDGLVGGFLQKSLRIATKGVGVWWDEPIKRSSIHLRSTGDFVETFNGAEDCAA
jgi:hypothetical protein